MGVNSSPALGGEGFITTSIEAFANWGRKNSLWPMPFGTACCAIEMMGVRPTRVGGQKLEPSRHRGWPRACPLGAVVGGAW